MSLCLCHFGRAATPPPPRKCRAARVRATGQLVCDREVGVEEAIRGAILDTPGGESADDLRVDALAALRNLTAAGWSVRALRRRKAAP